MVACPARYSPRVDTGLVCTAKPSMMDEQELEKFAQQVVSVKCGGCGNHCQLTGPEGVPEGQQLVEAQTHRNTDRAALAGHRLVAGQQLLLVGVQVQAVILTFAGNGLIAAVAGDELASIGKAKSKKTFNVSAIVAAALKNGTVLLYSAELPKDKRKILYVDTEQSPYHCLKVMERILRMAGLPTGRNHKDLEFLVLRKYTPEERPRFCVLPVRVPCPHLR